MKVGFGSPIPIGARTTGGPTDARSLVEKRVHIVQPWRGRDRGRSGGSIRRSCSRGRRWSFPSAFPGRSSTFRAAARSGSRRAISSRSSTRGTSRRRSRAFRASSRRAEAQLEVLTSVAWGCGMTEGSPGLPDSGSGRVRGSFRSAPSRTRHGVGHSFDPGGGRQGGQAQPACGSANSRHPSRRSDPARIRPAPPRGG